MPTPHLTDSLPASKAATEVQIFVGDDLIGTTTANGNGIWSVTASGLTLGAHTFTAKSAGVTSVAKTLSVIAQTPELVFDPSPVTLQGIVYIVGEATPTLPPGSTITRTATGGVPPYTYTSLNPAVANVNAAGLVSPRNNGTATITARDSAAQSKSFTVTVGNVWIAHWIGRFIHDGAVGYQLPGGHLPNRAELKAIGDQYLENWPYARTHFWSSERQSTIPDLHWARLMPGGGDQTFLGAVPVETLSIVPATLTRKPSISSLLHTLWEAIKRALKRLGQCLKERR